MKSDGTYCDPLFEVITEDDGEEYCVHVECSDYKIVEGIPICSLCNNGYEVEFSTTRCIIECPTGYLNSIDGLYCVKKSSNRDCPEYMYNNE
jgi:hypothetical protein